jgi:hypothetical protein
MDMDKCIWVAICRHLLQHGTDGVTLAYSITWGVEGFNLEGFELGFKVKVKVRDGWMYALDSSRTCELKLPDRFQAPISEIPLFDLIVYSRLREGYFVVCSMTGLSC